MKAIQTVLIGAVIISLAATQYFQGKTIAALQADIATMTKTDMAHSEGISRNAESIKGVCEVLKIQNKTIRTLAGIR